MPLMGDVLDNGFHVLDVVAFIQDGVESHVHLDDLAILAAQGNIRTDEAAVLPGLLQEDIPDLRIVVELAMQVGVGGNQFFRRIEAQDARIGCVGIQEFPGWSGKRNPQWNMVKKALVAGFADPEFFFQLFSWGDVLEQGNEKAFLG